MTVVWVDERQSPKTPTHYIRNEQGEIIPCESCQVNREKYLKNVNLSESLEEWMKNNPPSK